MRVDDRLGTFEAVASATPRRATLEAVRALVAEPRPDAVEVASRRGPLSGGASARAGCAAAAPTSSRTTPM